MNPGRTRTYQEQDFVCDNCHSIFKRISYPSFINQKNKFCSKSCCCLFQRGSNNPNFGHRWNSELKEKQSNIIKQRYIDRPELREISGNSNRGKKLTSDQIKKWHSNPIHYSHSDESKKRIGEKSSQKFTKEYLINIRKKMECGGWWIPLNEKSEWQLYNRRCDWRGKLTEFYSDSEKILLLEHGIFSSFGNVNGLVRDHKYSKMNGFENKVFPIILRHPENCQLIFHRENVAKRFYKNKDSIITLSDLFNSIKIFSKIWKEQDKCIYYIQLYENGNRWSKEEEINKQEI